MKLSAEGKFINHNWYEKQQENFATCQRTTTPCHKAQPIFLAVFNLTSLVLQGIQLNTKTVWMTRGCPSAGNLRAGKVCSCQNNSLWSQLQRQNMMKYRFKEAGKIRQWWRGKFSWGRPRRRPYGFTSSGGGTLQDMGSHLTRLSCPPLIIYQLGQSKKITHTNKHKAGIFITSCHE